MQASSAEFLHDGRLAIVDDDRFIVIGLEDGSTQEVRIGPLPWASDVYFEPSWLSIRRDGTMVVGVHDGRTTLFDVAARRLRDLTAPALTDPRAGKFKAEEMVELRFVDEMKKSGFVEKLYGRR